MPSELAELRRKAAALGVEDWEDLTRDQLADAVADAEGAADHEADVTGEAQEPEEEAMPTASATRSRRRTNAAEKATPTRARTKRAAATTKTTAKATKATKAVKTTKKVAKAATKAPRRQPRGNKGSEANPFRSGSNLWHITEALMRGGSRADLVAEVKPLLNYKPRVQDVQDFDTDAETDRRLKVVGYILKNRYGWSYTHEGRGPEAFIQAVPPGA